MTYATEWSKPFGSKDKLKFRVFGSVVRYLRHRKDYRYLKRLPQYLLDDVDLSREKIDAAERANRLLL